MLIVHARMRGDMQAPWAENLGNDLSHLSLRLVLRLLKGLQGT